MGNTRNKLIQIFVLMWIKFIFNVHGNINDERVITRFSIDATKANGIGPSPSTVAAFLCSEKDELIYLTRQASLNQILLTVKNPLDGFDDEIFSKDLNFHQSYYLLDVNCPGANDILLKANSTGMFIGPRKWLLIKDSRKNNTDIYKMFENLSLFPDSDMVIGERINTDLVKLISIYKPSRVGEVIIENRGYWKDGKGISSKSTEVSSVRRRDLRRTALKSCLVITHPDSINHLTDFHDKHIDTITKVNYPWILMLVEMMNATVNFTMVDSWGYRDSKGNWSGMIGMLDRKEIDLGGTAVFFTSERTDVIQYVSLYTPTRAYFIFRRPPLSYVSNIFVLPFQPMVWLATGVFLIIVAILLYIAWRWEWSSIPNEEFEKPMQDVKATRISWSDNILIIIGAISQQGSTFEPRRLSPRIILLMLFVAVLSLYTSYTANIVALLQSSTGSINSLEKLLHSSLKLGVDDTVYNRHYFAAFQDPVRKAIYEQKIIPNGQKHAWMNMEEGVRRVRKGLFAFHAESGSAYKLIQETFHEEEKCGLEEIDHLHVIDPLLAIQKRSPYLEIIKVGLLKIHESGLQTRHITRLYTRKPVCHGHTSFISVGLIDCYSALATLGWGTMLSLIILCLEFIWRRMKSLGISEEDASQVGT